MSSSKKIALVLKKGVDWKSCTSISSNLVKSYESHGYDIKHFDIPMYSEFPADFISASKKICKYEPDVISFVDHGEAPSILITHYLLSNKNCDSEFIFHIYGDFTYFLDSWVRTLELLKGKKVKLLCASEAQCEIVRSVLELRHDEVEKVPFSVDSKDFYYEEKLRSSFRERYGLGEEDKVLFYTGRISLQKNVVYLVECFRDFCQKFGGEKTHLFIAGPCDDIGMPYLNKNLMINFYRSKFLESIEDMDNVHYLGMLETKDLNELCCGADIYCSLSVHNDEDFGMAPAEAFMTGCRGVLTSWGGYKDYIKLCDQVDAIPVEIKNDFIDISTSHFYKNLMKHLSESHDNMERQKRAEKACSVFSLKQSMKNIKSMVGRGPERFEGVSVKAVRFAEKSKDGRLYSKASFSDEYLDIYKGKYDKKND